jgi:hypothetical protein
MGNNTILNLPWLAKVACVELEHATGALYRVYVTDGILAARCEPTGCSRSVALWVPDCWSRLDASAALSELKGWLREQVPTYARSVGDA